jgi:3D (Asp-Asp-Asp) domain-containing protein
MKRFITTSGLAMLLVSTAAAARPNIVVVTKTTTVRKETVQTQSLLARVTVYWAGGRGSDRYTRQHKSATGLRLRQGHCAVDPRKIPYGSQIIFPDRTGLVAVDTGSAVRSRKAARRGGRTAFEKGAIVVDRFFETKGQALAWASRNPAFMTVRVVPPNSRAPLNVQTPTQSRVPSRAIATNAPPPVNTLAPVGKSRLSVPKPVLQNSPETTNSARRKT